MKQILESLNAQGLFSDLDLHFALLMGKLSGDHNRELLLAAALVSRASGEGHVCLRLAEWSDCLVGEASRGQVVRLPLLSAWKEALLKSSVIGHPGERKPLILDHADRLYLHRYWVYEQRLGADLLTLGDAETILPDIQLLKKGLSELFPVDEGQGTNWQKVAATVSVLKRLTVISGGPGTGKTSTVVRILALLQQQAGASPLSIALAAPTGKAAARLQASIQQAISALSLDDSLRNMIPDRAMTLHRLMGSRRDSVFFRHNADNPLPYDLLVIDEASMVDVALMAKVIAALPARCRLILLGDRNQLASVEAGAVLGDLCSEGQGFTSTFSGQLNHITGETIPNATSAEYGLSDSIVELTHSYRFDQQSGIGQLARAVNRGDADRAVSLLSDASFTDIGWISEDCAPVDAALTGYTPYLELIQAGAPVKAIFKAFEAFRVLCALRSGEQGVSGLNKSIYQRLSEAGLIEGKDLWYPGRPILITQNDHHLKLYNGDVGILLRDESGQKKVTFTGADGYRRIRPARIPAHETAFAMTVHKSQGSEFDQILMVLPHTESAMLNRELIYTGLTRSRSQLTISGPQAVLVQALRQRTQRASGLKDQLWGRGKKTADM